MAVRVKPVFDFNHDKTFQNSTADVLSGVDTLQNSNSFYVTPEICRELKHIKNGVTNMKLDDDILRTCSDWCVKNNPDTLQMERRGANSSLEQASKRLNQTAQTIDVNNYSKLVDNQARQAHHSTIGGLRNGQREMAPYAHASIGRLQNFCDYIGVTDRFQSYRSNLNYQRPGTFQKSQMPKNMTYDSNRYAKSAPSQVEVRVKERAPIKDRSIQEQCGVNTVFPGISEYKERYIPHPEKKTQDFEINPTPDFGRSGRKMAVLKYTPSTTEYKKSYVWPDGNKIKTSPWASGVY